MTEYKHKKYSSNKLSAAQCGAQLKPNKTGFPDNLKFGIENLSGHSMDILDLIHSGQDLTIEKANGFEYLKFHEGEVAIAFKALKISLSMKAKELTIKKIYESQDAEIRDRTVEIINNDLASIIPSIEFNPSNAGEFFEWRPMGLEDVEMFLGN
ncbi:hypothetical protein [Ekhidna sp.]|uniref:hypothetical protein n=1 Tax=Ekhidna sp. TaxID=2608089 RepID=UPI003296E2BE